MSYRRKEQALKTRMRWFFWIFVLSYLGLFMGWFLATTHYVQMWTSSSVLVFNFLIMAGEVGMFLRIYNAMRRMHRYEFERTRKSMRV